MSSETDDFDSEEVSAEEIELLRSIYGTSEPVGDSRLRPILLGLVEASAGGDDASIDAAQRRGQADVAEAVMEVLGAEAQRRRERNRSILRFDGPGSEVEQLADLHLVMDAIQLEAHDTIRYGGDYAEMAASDIAQSATTTTGAITVLLRNGFVLDAEARWRGLHELACATTLLASDGDPAAISTRYLAHGQRLPQDDPAYMQPWAQAPTFHQQHEWLRASYANVSKKGIPQRFTQSWLFSQANLVSAPFGMWINPSHSPVHMTSTAVARGRLLSGSGDPAGYDAGDARQICWQTACSLYELGSSIAVLLANALPAERLLAWTDELRRRADDLRPGPRLR